MVVINILSLQERIWLSQSQYKLMRSRWLACTCSVSYTNFGIMRKFLCWKISNCLNTLIKTSMLFNGMVLQLVNNGNVCQIASARIILVFNIWCSMLMSFSLVKWLIYVGFYFFSLKVERAFESSSNFISFIHLGIKHLCKILNQKHFLMFYIKFIL